VAKQRVIHQYEVLPFVRWWRILAQWRSM